MRAINTEHSNFTYLGDGENVGNLPCQRAQLEGGPHDGARIVYSVWAFSDEERAQIAAGANIKLGIYLEPIPPVSLQVVDEREPGQ